MSQRRVSQPNVDGIARLSPLQEGLLFHALYAPDSGVYFEQFTCELHGELKVRLFELAWEGVVERHEALRALFTWERREHPLQVIRKRVKLPFSVLDWSDSESEGERLEHFLAEDRRRGLRLDEAPVMRITLIRVAPDRHRLVWSFHHLLLDGWSQRLVLRQVLDFYQAAASGVERPELPPAPRYRDYIAWLARQDHRAAEPFWRAMLSGFTQANDLRLHSAARLSDEMAAHGEHHVEIPEVATAALAAMARRERVTLNTVVRGAWALLVSRYSGESDVVFGATVSGRQPGLDGAEDMVGLLINTLPVRAQVVRDERVNEWLRGLQSQQVQISEHEHSSLADVKRWSDVPSGEPLFETVLVFENHPAESASKSHGSLIVREPRYVERSNFPLALLVVPGPTLELIFVHDPRRFEVVDVERLSDQMCVVLDTFAASPNRKLADVPLGGADALHRMLVDWGEGRKRKLEEQTVIDLFESAATREPQGVALVYDGDELTYSELERQARGLARVLRASGVDFDSAVGICLERSFEMVKGILGILMAGGAYVPIDPEWPKARRDFILDDTGAQVVVTTSDLADVLGRDGCRVLCVDALPEAPTDETKLPQVSPDQRAYIIYTSGSTGRAKGVEITHRNLLYSTSARFEAYPSPVERFLLLSSFTFDSSIVGIFWSLCQGGTLVLPPKRIEQDAHRLAGTIADAAVSHTLCLPSVYALLLEHADPAELASLRTVIVAGEVCDGALGAQHAHAIPDAVLYNEYGPTEATVWSAFSRVSATPSANTAPIGRPPPNVRLYLLDNEKHVVPVGVPGEIYVGGKGVALGYLNQPELTAERFPTLELPGLGSQRLYRTGDLARWRGDGNLEFLGRRDRQVKLRGHRVELEEIESTLKAHPAVSDAAVRLWDRDSRKDDGSVLERRLLALGPEVAERLLSDVEKSSEHV